MAGLSAQVPIAALSPELDAQSSKSVRAIVTLTWPYSSATGSVAFLLAEPDFRLRRSKGQVRVQFSGSSAKIIAKSGIASGDEVIISLDGVEWLRNASTPATPGTGIDFELKFTERLLLQFTQEGSEAEELIDIDHPPPDPEQDAAPNREITPEPLSPEFNKPPKRDAVLKNGDEWSSPAFIKRARTSYGSLFDTGYDPFAEEDGTIPGKGRKKSRLSSTWRYVSRSPSPEPEEESIPASSPTAAAVAVPAMADERSQPVSLGDTDAAETLAHFSREAGGMLRNAEASMTGDGHVSFGAGSPLIEITEMQPPATIRPSINTTDATQQFSIQQSTPTQAPSSPRLKPVPSDALPLVSPLVTSQSSPFKASGEAAPALGNQPTNLIFQQPSEHAGDTSIDQLFAASSESHDEDEHIPLSTFQEHHMRSHELNSTGFEGSFHPHGPFGHWNSPSAPELLGHGAEQGQEFYVGEIVESGAVTESFDGNLEGPPAPHSNIPSYPQYEPPDTQLHGHDLDALFAPGAAPVAYPELPEHATETTHIETHGQSPSADKAPVVKDTTSGVVDLTESDEDEDDQGISERSLDDRADEGSMGGDDVEEEEEEEEIIGSQASKFDTDGWRPAYPGQDGMEPEDYDGYSEEDEGDDRSDREEDFSDEDGEGEEYDEDEMEDAAPQRPSAPKEPVVIDLLSSDDEDNAAPAPPATKSPQKPPALEEESESEEEEEGLEEVDEKMDDVQDVEAEKEAPSQQLNEPPTGSQHENVPALADEQADDQSADEEFEDAREEDTQLGKENIPDALEETSAIPPGKATNGSTKDTSIPTDKPSRRRLPEDHGYNLDGANDIAGASPKKSALRRRSRDLKAKSQEAAIDQAQPPLQESIQLPTPDATQVSVAKDSQSELAAAETVASMIDDSQASTTAEAVDATQKADDTVIEQEEVKSSGVTAAGDEFAEAKEKEAEQDRTEAGPSTRRTSARLSHDHHKPEAQADNNVEDPQKESPPNPRRSRRIRHASGSAAQIAEIMRPSTPDDARAGETDETSPAAPNTLSKEGAQDPSVEMATSALKSSPKPHHDLRSTSVVDLKLSLSRALRTDLSEFTALKVLRFHINQKLDVFGIVTSTPGEPQRMKGGPRHYQVTFNITDSSVAPSGVTEVQVFRPYSEALPVVQEGDGILLRNFQVIAIKNRGFALRSDQNEACSWAVFKDGMAEPEVRGPPVEYGEGETKHMAAMKEWYGTLDAASVAKLQRANADKGGVGKGGGKAS